MTKAQNLSARSSASGDQGRKVLYFDSVGGASGDMVLAALLDLGADLGKIQADLKRMVRDRFSIEAVPVRQKGFRGLQVRVHIPPHHHGGNHVDHHEHSHRGLKDIEQLIAKSSISPPVKKNAIGVFRRLAEAEAKVHGVKPSDIHFHEVGALDSIIDIVGSCIALEQLGAERVALGILPLGCGTIKCAHGILPSPAPATVELLKGFAVEQTGEKHELVTPTGAALLTTWKNCARAPAGAVMVRTGCGFGHSELDSRPNLLRAVLFVNEAVGVAEDSCLVLECNLDDMSPQITGRLTELLFKGGALDVFITPVQMKKNRPGALLTVLCPPALRSKMLDLIFSESTTFGVREHEVRRTVLPRRFETVKTPYGSMRVKIGSWGGRNVTIAPEYEDCRKLAEKAGVPLRRVYEVALARRVIDK